MNRKLINAIYSVLVISLIYSSAYSQTRSNKNSNTNDGRTTSTQTSSPKQDHRSANKSSNKNRNSNSNYDSPAELALDRLRTLQGTWYVREKEGLGRQVVLQNISKGAFSIKNAFSNQEAMFYLSHDRELLTNCCSADGRLQLLATSIDDNQIALSFVDSYGKPEGDSPYSSLVLFFGENGKLSLRLITLRNGVQGIVEHIELEQESAN